MPIKNFQTVYDSLKNLSHLILYINCSNWYLVYVKYYLYGVGSIIYFYGIFVIFNFCDEDILITIRIFNRYLHPFHQYIYNICMYIYNQLYSTIIQCLLDIENAKTIK